MARLAGTAGPILAAWLLAACGGEDAQAADPPPQASPASRGAAPEEAAGLQAELLPAPGIWSATYDRRKAVLEGRPRPGGDGDWEFGGAPGSEWEIRGVRPLAGGLAFEMRHGGRLTGKLVQFEGVFDAGRERLEGQAYDGLRRSTLVFRRTD